MPVKFTSKTEGARHAAVFDSDTGEELHLIVSVDSATGMVERLIETADGVVVSGGNDLVTVEERRNFRVVHRPTGIVMCRYPQ